MHRLRHCRERCGLSQKQVALEIGVAAPTVSQWESEIKTPSSKNWNRLANLYGVSVDYLMGRSDTIDASDTSRVIPYNEAMETLHIVLTEDEHEALTLYQGAESIYQEIIKDVLRAHQRKKKSINHSN